MKQRKLSGGTIYILIIIVLVLAFASTVLGGFTPYDPTTATPQNATAYIPAGVAGNAAVQKSLQLKELTFVTLTPTPVPQPAPVVQLPPTTPPNPPAQNPSPVKKPSPPIPSNNYCKADTPKLPTCECNPYESINLICPEDPTKTLGERIQDCSSGGGNYMGGTVTGTNGIVNCAFPENSSGYNANSNNPNCSKNCWGKPVIYLYPTTPTEVNVALTIPGNIIESIPQYPTKGWQNILALPSGMLIYRGTIYHELYYESQVTVHTSPSSGLIIPTKNLKERLLSYTYLLGLLPPEQQEFLDYWLPRLYALKSDYIQFSVLSPFEKEQVDHVAISPTPQTRIEFLVYFKPLSSPVTSLKPLQLPVKPVKRIGFTEVEWGGTIDD